MSALQAMREQGHELVVVDGGSRDDSLSIASQLCDSVIVSHPGRSLQMNNGAAAASGDVYLFLHADTSLPADAMTLVKDACGSGASWGRFDVSLSGESIWFRIIEWSINLRSRLSSIATGDQAIFIDRVLFEDVKGFPEIALMEDIELSKKLKSHQKPACLQARVKTSSRRWERHGVLRTVILMWKLRLYYYFGVSPEVLREMYR